ncbi:MAG: hypothetical protein GY862_32195 [Gammaproteobacteria bacterium]|nr:hypothetical protein [Gammaproteobacteria bacterium]
MRCLAPKEKIYFAPKNLGWRRSVRVKKSKPERELKNAYLDARWPFIPNPPLLDPAAAGSDQAVCETSPVYTPDFVRYCFNEKTCTSPQVPFKTTEGKWRLRSPLKKGWHVNALPVYGEMTFQKSTGSARYPQTFTKTWKFADRQTGELPLSEKDIDDVAPLEELPLWPEENPAEPYNAFNKQIELYASRADCENPESSTDRYNLYSKANLRSLTGNTCMWAKITGARNDNLKGCQRAQLKENERYIFFDFLRPGQSGGDDNGKEEAAPVNPPAVSGEGLRIIAVANARQLRTWKPPVKDALRQALNMAVRESMPITLVRLDDVPKLTVILKTEDITVDNARKKINYALDRLLLGEEIPRPLHSTTMIQDKFGKEDLRRVLYIASQSGIIDINKVTYREKAVFWAWKDAGVGFKVVTDGSCEVWRVACGDECCHLPDQLDARLETFVGAKEKE